jgi:site-specific DNA recombinase
MKVAIYSRKSKFTGVGESTQNQIELCKEYAKNHFDVIEFIIYEDEGFSGGSTDRPQYQKMIHDAETGKFDVLMCYRLDRVSRNISDFSGTIEILQRKNVAFVSLREQFDTTTPMGRAMMFIASVFAQLERETIAERVKDNMHQLARSGRWLGGTYPTGFHSEPIIYLDQNMKEKKMFKLIPIPDELEKVKVIFQKYLDLGSLSKLETYCLRNNIKTANDKEYQKQTLKFILTNPVYVIADQFIYDYLNLRNADICNSQDEFNGKFGLMGYNKRDVKNNRLIKFNGMSDWIISIGKHKGIIPGKDWAQVQMTLTKNRDKFPRHGSSSAALLSGLIRCRNCGSFMRVLYGEKKPRSEERYKYYTCNMRVLSKGDRCNAKRINVETADQTVIDTLKNNITKSLFNKIRTAKKQSKDKGSKVKVLNDHIDRNSKAIENLVKQLSLNETSIAAEFLIKEIERLGLENKTLQNKLEQDTSEMENFNLDILLESLIAFMEKIDTATFEEKRKLLQGIVDRIEWDGEKLHTKIFELN